MNHSEVETSFSRSQMTTSTLTRQRPEPGEESKIIDGNSDERYAPSNHEEDSNRDDEEARNDLTITGEFTYRRHVVPRVELYMAK